MQTLDEKWMRIAIEEANLAMKENEVPVGAVLVRNNKLIARAHNQPISKNDPTAHAELEALRLASLNLETYRLPKTSLYVTLEPCAMCFGAMIHARVDRVVFGAYDFKSGVCGSAFDLSSKDFFNHKLQISGGVLSNDCQILLQSFFKSLRNKSI